MGKVRTEEIVGVYLIRFIADLPLVLVIFNTKIIAKMQTIIM